MWGIMCKTDGARSAITTADQKRQSKRLKLVGNHRLFLVRRRSAVETMSQVPSSSGQGSWLPWGARASDDSEPKQTSVAGEAVNDLLSLAAPHTNKAVRADETAKNESTLQSTLQRTSQSTSQTVTDTAVTKSGSVDPEVEMAAKAPAKTERTLSKKESMQLPTTVGNNGWFRFLRRESETVQMAGADDDSAAKDSDIGADNAIEQRPVGVEDIDYDDDDQEDDYDNGNEVDDHVTKKSSTWRFWNTSASAPAANGNDNGNDNGNGKHKEGKDPKEPKETKDTKDTKELKDPKEPKRLESFSNTILESSHSLSPRLGELLTLSGSGGSDDDDDAVLYKPHSNTSQFEKINTHKNENLRENDIVPDWDSCLPHQASVIRSNSLRLASTLFGNDSTSNTNINTVNSTSSLDFANWRHFLGLLSSKLGFSSHSLASVIVDDVDRLPDKVNDDEHSSGKVEREYNLLYEKTYRLYGRSLAKLPEHKRACLPNYNRYYTEEISDGPGTTQLQYTEHSHKDRAEANGAAQTTAAVTSGEEDDDNDISISNDPMGNLLINHKAHKAFKRPPPVVTPQTHNIRAGPLVKIKKILIIGVHGFFPTKMVRPFIGTPKGTSTKFANEAEKGVIRYCIENKLITPEESKVSIQKIALEMEGKIMDRVEFFTSILQKWSRELNEADFIFIASHSQGCVVSIILLARLISLGILKDPIYKRIGILGMAGINNGPFYGIDKSLFMKAYSAIENESMSELFELNKFNSVQSLAFKELIQIIINANVKLCLIGSINDQLVPLYSALANHTFHPNIYRACYIDHSTQAPTFIKKMVSLCCQLQNLGFFENNVIKELSTILAGPLTGSGHSKIYNDGKVYDLGIKFVLDTDDIVIPPPKQQPVNELAPLLESSGNNGLVLSGTGTYGSVANGELGIVLPRTNQIYIKEYNISKIGTNPFILPWCFRGLLFNIEKNWPNNNNLLTVTSGNQYGKTGYDEINSLSELFEEWKPESKLYKELKYRLNGIRASKL